MRKPKSIAQSALQEDIDRLKQKAACLEQQAEVLRRGAAAMEGKPKGEFTDLAEGIVIASKRRDRDGDAIVHP